MCKVAYLLIYLTYLFGSGSGSGLCNNTSTFTISCVCVPGLSLSREDYALYLPLGAIILHDEGLRALLTMARKFRFRRVWVNLAIVCFLLDGWIEGVVGVGEGYM